MNNVKNLFKPTWQVDSAYHIHPAQLKERGIRAVFSDLDNTLIAWDNPNGTPELKQWLQDLRAAQIPLVVVSNNSRRRIGRAVAQLNIPFVARALKPLAHGITKTRRRLGLTKEEVVMVGDQLLTDVVAANRAGVRSILVRPLIDSDKWNTRINRAIEHRVGRRVFTGGQPDWRRELND